MDDLDYKLCYIDREGHRAFFTTAPLDKQWGDDWNDAPYEHNAEPPYEYANYMAEQGTRPYDIQVVYFDSDLCTPDSGHHNSPWSIERINAGQVAWLRDSIHPDRFIMAGTTLVDFKRKITSWGGTVYEKTVPTE